MPTEGTPVEGTTTVTEGDPGTQEPVTINWDNVSVEDIPETVIKTHSAYKGLLGESVERRQANSALKQELDAIAALQGGADDGGGAGEDNEPVIEDNPVTPDPQTAIMQGQIDHLLSVQAGAVLGLARNDLIKQHKIPEAAQQFVTGNTPDELADSAVAVAQYIKDSAPAQGDGTSPGNAGTEATSSAIAARIRKTLQNPAGEESIFTPARAAKTGGGAVRNN